MPGPLLTTDFPHWPVRRGKVRDVYDLGDRLLIVSTDRISAFDWVLPQGIPDKGRVLTQLSIFWFSRLPGENHFLGTCLDGLDFGAEADAARRSLAGRCMLVRKAEVVPIECVVRGYLSGSGWKEYQAHGNVCGIHLPSGLVESSRLPEPIFTPATKAETGHDQNISFTEMVSRVGEETAGALRAQSLRLYETGAEYARERGILIADTKFEFGFHQGRLILIDEALTPDSSRFWPTSSYRPGGPQPSFDKQPVRDWLETTGWDKASPPPDMPEEVVAHTRERYVEAYERLTGQEFSDGKSV